SCSRTQSVPVQVLIERFGVVVATVFAGQLGPGPQTITWDGTSAGARVPDGDYQAVTVLGAGNGVSTYSAPMTVDTTPPTLTLLDPTTLRFQLSEPATVALTVNGQQIGGAEPAGEFTLPLPPDPVASISAQATDVAGNRSAAVTYP